MIKVIINYVDDKFHNLKIDGHANSGEYGQDLVCAGVSSIVIGALNNLEHKNYDIKVTEGHVEVTKLKSITTHDEIVIETMLVQLESIAESYPKNIKIIK